MGLDLQFLVIRRIHSHSPGVTVKKRRDISCLPLDGPRSSSCRSVLAELGSHPNWGTSHIYPCTHPSTYPSTYLSISLSLSLSLDTVYNISIYLYLVLSFFLSFFISFHFSLSTYLSIYLPIYLPTCTYEGFLEWVYPKMMVSNNGKSQTRMDDDWGYTYDLGNLHICIATTNHPHRRGNFNVAPAQALMEACGGDIEKCT